VTSSLGRIKTFQLVCVNSGIKINIWDVVSAV